MFALYVVLLDWEHPERWSTRFQPIRFEDLLFWIAEKLKKKHKFVRFIAQNSRYIYNRYLYRHAFATDCEIFSYQYHHKTMELNVLTLNAHAPLHRPNHQIKVPVKVSLSKAVIKC